MVSKLPQLKLQLKNSIRFILFIGSFLLIVSLVKLTGIENVRAQIPPPYVPCDQQVSPEFHSLRPYQASPCTTPINNDEQALLCGNDLIVMDQFSVPPPRPVTCTCWCDCTATCTFRVPRNFWIFLNAYDSEFPIAGNTELIPGGTPDQTPIEWTLKDYEDNLPPDILDPQFQEYPEYYEAYQDWRGRTCINLPIRILFGIKHLFLCFDNPLNPNFWAMLFPNIPYSSTEDRIGKIDVTDMDVLQTNIDQIIGPVTDWQPKPRPDDRNANTDDNETVLYFPHMEENVELTNLLQSTYLPSDLLTEEQPIGKVNEPNPGRFCRIADVRYNPGDQLFGETMDAAHNTGVPYADVSYVAVFQCTIRFGPAIAGCPMLNGCTKYAIFYSDVATFTPMIDELWSKTVAGNASVVKKIFPKIEPGAPIEEIDDIPGVSDVVHATGPQTQLISTNPEIYFPHLGGIYDYFLQDIQTNIRPKGYSAESAGLTKDYAIPELDRLNEYVSWYLNGTPYRAEDDPLSYRDEYDLTRVVNYSGPLNRLLSQQSQWWNKVLQPGNEEQLSGRVDQITERAEVDRHNQIAACTTGYQVPILGYVIGGYPIACNSASLNSVPPLPGQGTPPPGGPGTVPAECGNVPDSAIPQNYLALKPNFVSIADRLLPPCTGGDNNLAEECYNYVVSTSQSAGVNPAFSLAMWLHESGASNYCYAPSVLDLGMSNASPANLPGQLNAFLLLPFGSAARDCAYNTTQGWPTPMHGFLCTFATGGCDITHQNCDPNVSTSFYNDMNTYFNWVSGCGSLPSYPTDMSCP